MSQHIPLSRLIDLLNEEVHFSVSSRHAYLMYPECSLIHSDRQKCGAHTIRVNDGLILHWKRKIAGQIHNYRIRDVTQYYNSGSTVDLFVFKWSLHWYPASFLFSFSACSALLVVSTVWMSLSGSMGLTDLWSRSPAPLTIRSATLLQSAVCRHPLQDACASAHLGRPTPERSGR